MRGAQTTSEKIEGLKEQIAGKITRNPEKAEHGKEMRTGELKKKKKEEDDVRVFPRIADCPT